MMTASRQISTESSRSKQDYRIEVELEKLNKAVAEVNFFDGQLFETKMKFRRSLTESKKKLDKLYRSQKKWIERSKPYYELRAKLEELKKKLHDLELQYDRVRLDFQDARDNEMAAQRALVLLATRSEPSSTNSTATSTPRDQTLSASASVEEGLETAQKNDKITNNYHQEERERMNKLEKRNKINSSEKNLLRKKTDDDADWETTILDVDGDFLGTDKVEYLSDTKFNGKGVIEEEVELGDEGSVNFDGDEMKMDSDLNDNDMGLVINGLGETPLNDGETKRLSVEDGPEGEDIMENWNKATLKVMECAKMKSLVAEQIEHKMKQISDCQDKMDDTRLTMVKATDKARPYYTLRESLEQQFEHKLSLVLDCGRRLASAKETYQLALRQLDLLSTEIEQRRHLNDMRQGIPASNYTTNMSHFEELDHLPGFDMSTTSSSNLPPNQQSSPPTVQPLSEGIVLTPNIENITLHPARPEDQNDDVDGSSIHRSMSLIELSTRMWDNDISTHQHNQKNITIGSGDKKENLKLSGLTVNNTVLTGSDLNLSDIGIPGGDLSMPPSDIDKFDNASLSPTSQPYSVSFHMYI